MRFWQPILLLGGKEEPKTQNFLARRWSLPKKCPECLSGFFSVQKSPRDNMETRPLCNRLFLPNFFSDKQLKEPLYSKRENRGEISMTTASRTFLLPSSDVNFPPLTLANWENFPRPDHHRHHHRRGLLPHFPCQNQVRTPSQWEQESSFSLRLASPFLTPPPFPSPHLPKQFPPFFLSLWPDGPTNVWPWTLSPLFVQAIV